MSKPRFTKEAFQEGKEAYHQFCEDTEINTSLHMLTSDPYYQSIPYPDSGWALHSPEGQAWLRGWNEAALENDDPESYRSLNPLVCVET
jgi:hypothetical protein